MGWMKYASVVAIEERVPGKEVDDLMEIRDILFDIFFNQLREQARTVKK